MRKLLVGASALAFFLPVFGSAHAADPVIDSVYDWSGLYAGAAMGAQVLDGSVTDPAGGQFTSGNYSDTGLAYGGFLGFNHQVNSLVFGIEADLDGTNNKDKSTKFGRFANTDLQGTAEINLQGSLRGRLGYAADNKLFYVTGGYAWARTDLDFNYDFAPLADDSFKDTLNGWTVGGGFEYGWEKWSARLEYRYTDYGRSSSGIANCCAPAPDAQSHKLDTHSILLGIAYRL